MSVKADKVIYDKKADKATATGNVIIENDVAIGANCCVDRGTIESTIVGEFSKLDNTDKAENEVTETLTSDASNTNQENLEHKNENWCNNLR